MSYDDEQSSGNETVDTPLTPEELREIRKARRNPNYTPQSPVNPLHEHWTDTEVILLGPFFGMDHPPSIEEIDRVMKSHPALESRPGRPYHETGLQTLARYCFRHTEPEWHTVGLQLSKRGNFQRLLELHDLKPKG